MSGKRRWTARLLTLLACVVSAAAPGPVRAQAPFKGVRPDSLGLAADTVRVAVEELRGLGRCGIVGHAVVADSGDLARLKMYPQCADVDFPPLAGRTLVGLSVWVDCNGGYRVEAFRSESRRELRVRLWHVNGGCRGMRPRDVWIALPSGWAVRFTHAHASWDALPGSGGRFSHALVDGGR